TRADQPFDHLLDHERVLPQPRRSACATPGLARASPSRPPANALSPTTIEVTRVSRPTSSAMRQTGHTQAPLQWYWPIPPGPAHRAKDATSGHAHPGDDRTPMGLSRAIVDPQAARGRI